MSLRMLLQTGKAISLQVITQHIKKVFEMYNYNIVVRREIPDVTSFERYYDCALFIYPFGNVFALQKFFAYRVAKKKLKYGAVFYTMMDGVPKKYSIPVFVVKDVDYIANSYYTKSKIESIGAKVSEVIHHGYDPEEINYAKDKLQSFRKVLDSKYGDVVRFVYVGDFNIRKGLASIVNAVKELSKKRKDFVVLIYSKPEVTNLIKNVERCVYVGVFGSRPHYEMYLLYMSNHYLLFPSRCESFGLPLLEANAVGCPAVITDLPCFEEYADMNNNIVVGTEDVHLHDSEEGFYYELYLYDHRELAKAMDTAIEIAKNYPSKYEDMKEKVRERVKNMTIYQLYSRFLKYFKKQEENNFSGYKY